MKFECGDFTPLTHSNYSEAGCYGCANANIDIQFVWCNKEHWCMSMLLPVMDKGSDFFDCLLRKEQYPKEISLCEGCSLLKKRTQKCKENIKLREIVARFD